MAKAAQKSRNRKLGKKSFLKEYQAIMKGVEHVGLQKPAPQWSGDGDVFVKFSMYQDQKTIAHPYTVL